MVWLSLVRQCKIVEAPIRVRTPRKSQNWIDSLRVYCKGGHGGNGLQRYGGCGGQGGNVVLEAVDVIKSSKTKKTAKIEDLKSLYAMFRKEFNGDSTKQRVLAESGQDATNYKIIGSPGTDSVLKIPCGICVTDAHGSLMGQLNQVGERLTVALGGAGGTLPNGWVGQQGESRHVRLDFKLIADLGLVGFPNAGKSTLLKAISRASPKIAAYPFTTITPNLGKMFYEDHREVSMADLPGLIEGAHYNVGMGHRFLKHVERTTVMVFVVDVQGFQLKPHLVRRSAYETVALLNRELELYNPDLLLKPAICLVNKMDTEGSSENLDTLLKCISDSETNPSVGLEGLEEGMHPENVIRFREVMPMSAKYNRKDVERVKERVRAVLDIIDDEGNQNDDVVKQASDKLDLMIDDTAPRVF